MWSLKTLALLLLWLGLCLRWCVSVWSQTCSLVGLVEMGRLWTVHQLWHFLYLVDTLFLCHILTVSVVWYVILGVIGLTSHIGKNYK